MEKAPVEQGQQVDEEEDVDGHGEFEMLIVYFY